MYADDAQLTYASDNIYKIQASLNEDNENVHDWLRANKLALNMTKTEVMLIGSRQRLSTVTETQHIDICKPINLLNKYGATKIGHKLHN